MMVIISSSESQARRLLEALTSRHTPTWIRRVPVLRIHEILARIRSLLFSSVIFKTSKNFTKKKVFCLLLFEGTFTSFLKDKKAHRSHKTEGINFFLLCLLDDRRIRIREIQKHMDPDQFNYIYISQMKQSPTRMLVVSGVASNQLEGGGECAEVRANLPRGHIVVLVNPGSVE